VAGGIDYPGGRGALEFADLDNRVAIDGDIPFICCSTRAINDGATLD
jgi:hypothetical protein